MTFRKWVWAAPVVGAVGVGYGIDATWAAADEAAKQDVKSAVTLPVTQVVLFNSGVGYFARGGEVEGDARVDLTFQENDINDLLKSMVLQDFGGGRVSAVSYDSREPAARTLSSFAINLGGNPSMSGIIAQARGERVDVTVSPTAANQPGKLTGTVVGVESRKVPGGQGGPLDATFINLACGDGLRAVKMDDIQAMRFLNPQVESEFRRALEVLAQTHDSQKKAVSLHFAGAGKRKVQVGYVVDAPIWKTSYRLVLDPQGGDKPYLQGWAVVENPTDEDWGNVRMALVSGRPISFRMNLYDPLYVPRPVVEPELFASLRPQMYSGGFGKGKQDEDRAKLNFNSAGEGGEAEGLARTRLSERGLAAQAGGGPGGRPGAPPAPMAAKAAADEKMDGQALRRTAGDPNANFAFQRDAAAQLGRKMVLGDLGTSATGGAVGDFFQYVVDHPVSLARQKSALLPIVGKDVEGTRVSIYNPAVQPKHPLLGLRFKNTSGAHLAQGPVTVFEGSVYAGDAQVRDVQPNEERLIAYAIDQGTEVDPQTGPGSSRITSVKAVRGIVTTVTKVREEKKYRIINRSQTDRTLVIEHPNRTNQQFKLVETAKPVEDTADLYRFQTPVKAGETVVFPVVEERDIGSSVTLTNGQENQIRYFISLKEISPKLKEQLEAALAKKAEWDTFARELTQVRADNKRLTDDQDRIRKNLRETPKEAPVYQKYLDKLSDQEKEIDALTAKEKKLMTDEFAARKKYEDDLTKVSD